MEQDESAESTADDIISEFPGTGTFLNTGAVKKKKYEVLPSGKITLNFVDTDIREVVRAVLEEVLKLNYIIDSAVSGTVTIRTSRPVPANALISTLEEALRLNGAFLVKSKGEQSYTVLPINKMNIGNSGISVGVAASKKSIGAGVHVIPLQFVSSVEMQKILDSIAPKGAVLKTDKAKNLLIVSGTKVELDNILETISLFDVDWLEGMSFALFPIDFVDAKVVVEELSKMFDLGKDSPIKDLVRIVPIERLNSVLIVSPQSEYIDKVGDWITRLDRTIN